MKYLLDIPRTAMEVFNMLPEGTLCEVIDNTIYMSPSPTLYHQRLLGKIFAKLQSLVEDHNLGEAFVSPCDVFLDDEQSVVQPDILFVRRDRESILQKRGVIGAPDLAIEILSTNKTHDQQHKFELYQRNGVPEYIIIDPETKQVWHYILEEQQYVIQPVKDSDKLFIQQLDLSIAF